MTFKKIRKQKCLFTCGKVKRNSRNRKKRIAENQKKKAIPQNFKSYACNNYYIQHPYFNILFDTDDTDNTDNIDIVCPELLENTYTFSLPPPENDSNVRFSTLLKKVDDDNFKTVYTFV